MTKWNYGNASIADEWAQLAANSTKTSAKPFPADVPVLELLASESVTTIPQWLDNHQAELANVATHKVQIVDGAHYLHWTQSRLLGRAMADFVAAHIATSPKSR